MPLAETGLGQSDAAAIQSIAMLIAESDTPPEWLLKSLPQAIGSLRWQVEATRKYPSRNEIKRRLLRLNDSLTNVLNELEDDLLQEILRDKDKRRARLLEVYAERLRWLDNKVLNAFLDVPDGSGKHKHFLTEHVDPVTYCAELICVAWHKKNGRLPPHTNDKVWLACQRLWESAGGKARPSSSGEVGKLTGWRDQLQRAKRQLASKDRVDQLTEIFVPGSQEQGFFKLIRSLQEMVSRLHTEELGKPVAVQWSSLFSRTYGRLGRITTLEHNLIPLK